MAASRHDQHIADMFIASWLRVLLNSTGAVRSQGSSQGKRNIERQGIQRDEFNMTPLRFCGFQLLSFSLSFFLQVQNLDQNLADAQVQQEAALKSKLRHNLKFATCNRSFLEFNSLTMFNHV